MGEDRSEVGEPMHSLDVDADCLLKIPPGTDVCVRSPASNAFHAPVVDVDPVRRSRG